ncbi:MAG: YcgN family cysteine cluster protein [Gammaproteobacteria bacterium]|nr:YcgN family cysteine cluster protein [Gammaproteobacteria bacterium]
MSLEPPFWDHVPLEEMSESQWESLCDGCGRCCLQKLEDEESGEVLYTDLACQLYDLKQGGCKNYQQRLGIVGSCVKLTVALIPQFHWLPQTCAYRLLCEGQPLPSWHPLVSGTRNSVHAAHYSIVGRAVSELSVKEDDWEERVITWVK